MSALDVGCLCKLFSPMLTERNVLFGQRFDVPDMAGRHDEPVCVARLARILNCNGIGVLLHIMSISCRYMHWVVEWTNLADDIVEVVFIAESADVLFPLCPF